MDAQIEELEQHFETAHLNYLQQTAQRTHDFKELTQNDQKLSMDIDQKKKKIETLTTAITHWRAKIRQLTRETEERNRLLREEKHAIQKHYQQLKQRIHLYRYGNQPVFHNIMPYTYIVRGYYAIILFSRARLKQIEFCYNQKSKKNSYYYVL